MKDFFKKIWFLSLNQKVVLFACLLLIHFLWSVKAGFLGSIVDFHSFRQTQTAITTYYFIKDGFKLDYITPVLGPPWTIPFEFPVYQFIVGFLSKITGLILEPTGRIVSISFYIGSVIVAYAILRRLNLGRNKSLFISSLLFIEPLYRFWARTFMIETTALFLSLCFLYFFISMVNRKSNTYAIAMILFGILAALTKITTFFVYWVAAFAYLGYVVLILKQKKSVVEFAKIALGLTLPVLATVLWVNYCDILKSQSIQGVLHTSKSLKYWNYGRWDQKISGEVWLRILDNSLFMPYLVVPALLFYKSRYWILTLFCFGLWLSGPLVFTNLFFVHEYYACSNNIFLSMGIGFFILGCYKMEHTAFKYIAGLVLLPIYIYMANHQFNDFYRGKQQNSSDGFKSFGELIQKEVPEDEIILVFGDDWNSRIPYYSQRKAVMWNATFPLNDHNLMLYKENLKNLKVGALVLATHDALSDSELKKVAETFEISTANSLTLTDFTFFKSKWQKEEGN
jgi:hypothetical protein